MAVQQNSELKPRLQPRSTKGIGEGSKPYKARVTKRKHRDDELRVEIATLTSLDVLSDDQKGDLISLRKELRMLEGSGSVGRIMGKGLPEGKSNKVLRGTGTGKRTLWLRSQGVDTGPGKKAKRQLSKFKAKQRALANVFITGADRPLSRLDEQAKELGIYSETYHALNRIERKALVSTAYSAAQAAA